MRLLDWFRRKGAITKKTDKDSPSDYFRMIERGKSIKKTE